MRAVQEGTGQLGRRPAGHRGNAPHSFIRYWGTDVCSLMKLAAESRPCAEYLMGNHVYAQRTAQVGRELDAELAALLEHLGLPVPAELITDAHRN